MWDQRFSEPEYAYGREPNDFLAAEASRIPPGPVLCLAEGQGRNAVHLAGLGHPVHAVDASRVGLDKTLALAEERGVQVEVVHADLRDYVITPGFYSGIVSIFCHLPSDLRRQVHRGVVQGLRPGGAFVLEAFTPDQLGRGTGGPRSLELLYPLTDLRQDLAGLDLVHACETERTLHEGKYHDGVAAVVQVVGVRPVGGMLGQ